MNTRIRRKCASSRKQKHSLGDGKLNIASKIKQQVPTDDVDYEAVLPNVTTKSASMEDSAKDRRRKGIKSTKIATKIHKRVTTENRTDSYKIKPLEENNPANQITTPNLGLSETFKMSTMSRGKLDFSEAPSALHKNIRTIQEIHPDVILPSNVLHLNMLPTIQLSHAEIKPHMVQHTPDEPETILGSIDERKMLPFSSLELSQIEVPSPIQTGDSESAYECAPEVKLEQAPPEFSLPSLPNDTNNVDEKASFTNILLKSEEDINGLVLCQEDLVTTTPCITLVTPPENLAQVNDNSAGTQIAAPMMRGQFILPNDLEVSHLPLEDDPDRESNLVSERRINIQKVFFELANFMPPAENSELDFECSLFHLVEKEEICVCGKCNRNFLPIGDSKGYKVMYNKCQFDHNCFDSINPPKKRVNDILGQSKAVVIKLHKMEDDQEVSELLPISYLMTAKCARQRIAKKRLCSFKSKNCLEGTSLQNPVPFSKKRKASEAKKCLTFGKEITTISETENVSQEIFLLTNKNSKKRKKSQNDKSLSEERQEEVLLRRKLQNDHIKSRKTVENNSLSFQQDVYDIRRKLPRHITTVKNSKNEIVYKDILTKDSMRITSGDLKKQILAEAEYLRSKLNSGNLADNATSEKLSKCTIVEPTDFIHLETAVNGRIIFKNAASFLNICNKIPVELTSGCLKVKARVVNSKIAKPPRKNFEFKDMIPIAFKAIIPKYKKVVNSKGFKSSSCRFVLDPRNIQPNISSTILTDPFIQRLCPNFQTKENNENSHKKTNGREVEKIFFDSETGNNELGASDLRTIHPYTSSANLQNSTSKTCIKNNLLEKSEEYEMANLNNPRGLEKQTNVKRKFSTPIMDNQEIAITFNHPRINQDSNFLNPCFMQNGTNIISNVSEIINTTSIVTANHMARKQSVHSSFDQQCISPYKDTTIREHSDLQDISNCNHRNQQNNYQQIILEHVKAESIVDKYEQSPILRHALQTIISLRTPYYESNQKGNIHSSNIFNGAGPVQNFSLASLRSFNGPVMRSPCNQIVKMSVSSTLAPDCSLSTTLNSTSIEHVESSRFRVLKPWEINQKINV